LDGRFCISAAGRGLFFFIHTSKSKTHKLGISVALNFIVVQNIRDSYLLVNFSQIFGCGSVNIVEESGIVSFSVRNLSDITDKIIPFFEEYSIQGVKAKDFNEFKEASILMKSKLHLTKEGLYKILLIKSRMIFNRSVLFYLNNNTRLRRLDTPSRLRRLATTLPYGRVATVREGIASPVGRE
jgi:hypothetical protein